MIITAKTLAIIFGLSLTAFTISTIVLAVQKSNLSFELDEANKRLDYLEQILNDLNKTTTTTTSTSMETTTDPTTGDPTSPATEQPPENEINYRLPTNAVPIHYDLQLHPDVDGGTFTGQVLITVNILEDTNNITLHANAEYLKINFVYTLGNRNKAVEWTLVPEREFIILNLENQATAGSSIKIGIGFSGIMLNKIVGLYSSSYLKVDGTQKLIVTSKFEPTFARQAFPCFDEPDKKATFNVTMVRPTKDDYHALSNMDILEEMHQGDFTEVIFRKSVPMSTYLACFIISDFASKSGEVNTQGIGKNFEMRAFATPQQLDKVDFALATGISITEYYIQYFNIEYPLPKLDMVAIPDFVSGAMEHWGLLTYRETALLYDKNNSSTINKQRVANVVAHELAHMWFGNLVTMVWWNNLWLNEGFARYMEYKGVDSVYPDWNMHDQFLVNALQSVMKYDATLASHPIVQTVESPAEITELFDTITYEKGASIIRMLEDFVGSDNFQVAVTNYLNNNKFSNAVTEDLLNEIKALGFDFDVILIMSTWTEQRGFPLVNVKKVSDGVFKITQKPFLANSDDYASIHHNETEFGYRWTIPLTYFTSKSKQVERMWFNYDQDDVTINVPNDVEWIKLNSKQVGFYRVNYDEDIWKLLIEELFQRPTEFSVADRAQLLNDVFSLADAAQISYDIALDATTYLENEHDYVPWNVASTKLLSLQQILMYSNSNLDFLHYARNIVQKVYDEVKWTVGTDHIENRLRISVLTIACSLGSKPCVDEVSKRFNDYINDPTVKPDPDLREIVYYYGMIYSGNENSWEKMWKLFVQEQDANEKIKLMYGLSGIQFPWILRKFVDLAWNESYVRSQDYFTCLENIALNPVGENVVWDYVRENWTNLVKRFGINERKLGRLIPSITGRFATVTKLEEMQNFFGKYPEAGAGTASRKTALENVKINIKWLAENQDIIANWLKNDKQQFQF